MLDVQLFSYGACPYAQRARMALIEKGIDFQLTEVDLYNKPDLFKQLSPYRKAPLMRHNGAIVYESRSIKEYIEDAFPAPAMMPRDPAMRAKARIWIDYCDSYLMPTLHKMIADRRDATQQARNIALVTKKFRFLEGGRAEKAKRRSILFGQRGQRGGCALHALHGTLPVLPRIVGRLTSRRLHAAESMVRHNARKAKPQENHQ